MLPILSVISRPDTAFGHRRADLGSDSSLELIEGLAPCAQSTREFRHGVVQAVCDDEFHMMATRLIELDAESAVTVGLPGNVAMSSKFRPPQNVVSSYAPPTAAMP